MHAAALLIAAASLSVDYGWRKADDGRLEYIIQVSPEQLARLDELPIASEIHPDAGQAQRFVIQVGSGPLPREAVEAPARGDAPRPEEDEPEMTVRGQSTADPYSLPAAGTAYRNNRSQPSSFGSRVQEPGYARPGGFAAPSADRGAVRVAQQPSLGSPAGRSTHFAPQSGQVTSPASGVEAGDVERYEPAPARGVWRGAPSPALDPLDAPSGRSIDAEFAAAERAGRETGSRQVQFAARPGDHSQASHTEEIESRQAPRRRSDWADEEEETDRRSSRGAPSPWTVTMMLLFASVGGNVWLGYLVWDLTHRFRDVASDNRRRRRQAEAVDGASV